VTNYSYDALDDLIGVVQGGSRNRGFVYDSLKRLTTSTNPESGTVSYGYDADSSVIAKVDARGITITYSYDKLDRLTGRTYSNGDPLVTYTYDQVVSGFYNIGRRTSMTNAAGSESWSYDPMGRMLTDQRTTNAIAKTTSYSYDYNGDTSTLTYAGGRTVTYTYNNAAQATSLADTVNNITYATGGAYAPQGALSALALGPAGSFTGINISNSYNKRLQPTEMKASSTAGTAFDLTYCFSNWVSGVCQTTGGNNGNVNGITNNLNSARTQSFTYDQLNRLSTATSSTWSLAFGYDSWANLLTATATGTATPLNLTVNANNQITTAPFAYDAAGNQTADATSAYTWNAEGELKTAGGVTYTYDGDGNRVQKSNGKIYWYGAGTEILDESDASGNITDEYVFFGGKRVAHRTVSSGSITYYAEDFIGSSTPAYDANGNVMNDFLHTYTWNAAGMAVTIDAVAVTYDALNRMVEQNKSGAYSEIVYSPTGAKLAVMNGQSLTKAFVPLPAGSMAVYNSSGLAYYRHSDWVGSSRFASTPSRAMYFDGAYAPFGEPYAQTGTTDLSFTGMNQDTVSNLYDFPAREYGIQGRWPSPDPAGLSATNLRNPQSFNRYSYVSNRPLIAVDPLGLLECLNPGPGGCMDREGGGGGSGGRGNSAAALLNSPYADPNNPIYFTYAITTYTYSTSGTTTSTATYDNLITAIFVSLAAEQMFGVTMVNFTPSQPGVPGGFTGSITDNNTDWLYFISGGASGGSNTWTFTVTNDVTSFTGFMSNSDGTCCAMGYTDPANPFVNFTATGMSASSTLNVQIFELGNSLALITGTDPSSIIDNPNNPGFNEPGYFFAQTVLGSANKFK
jgi:RHS repeat-associated protein